MRDEGGICRDQPVIAGRLVDAGRRAFEHRAIARLGGAQREHRVRALEREAQHLVEHRRADLLLQQIVERAAARGLDAELLLRAIDHDDDGHGAALALQAQERGQAVGIGQRQLDDDGREFALANRTERIGERMHFRSPRSAGCAGAPRRRPPRRSCGCALDEEYEVVAHAALGTMRHSAAQSSLRWRTGSV